MQLVDAFTRILSDALQALPAVKLCICLCTHNPLLGKLPICSKPDRLQTCVCAFVDAQAYTQKNAAQIQAAAAPDLTKGRSFAARRS